MIIQNDKWVVGAAVFLVLQAVKWVLVGLAVGCLWSVDPRLFVAAAAGCGAWLIHRRHSLFG
jgi:hypothetical protein